MLLYEFKADLNKYPRRGWDRRRRCTRLKDIIAFNNAHTDRGDCRYFGQEIMRDGGEEGAADRARTYKAALAKNRRLAGSTASTR